ncbi:MAG: hypothetical protein UC991_03275 [Gemmiger sp.]|uniref:MSCRAMM family protein n=1 Tax=Gemmiger sp. TaxID=2049027 RepID=UPI002E77E2CE|nr:SpaA isopeptide-forming pilin-related protein [Gemmiger sp.]MEE0497489.1 hypothetical protein [Gemmiger sp.]
MNRKTKWSHRLLALAMAAMMCCSVFPVGAFAETPPPQESTVVAEEQQTDETETDSGQTDASSPDPGADTIEAPVSSEVQNEECPEEEPSAEDAESMTEPPAQEVAQEPAEESEPYTFDGEILYADMPDAPTGSYLGSYGLPVATGETKIGLGAWDADLEQDGYLNAEALDSDNLTLAAPLLEDTDYAIVPILAQVEYPADGSSLDLILPDGVTLLDYYTLTETRPADGYALADDITFRLLQKADEDGSNLQEAEVYYLTTKNFLFWTWDDWKLLDDATVIMRDDITKVQISKVDIATGKELPGAELTITDKNGKELDRWVSTDTPHYIEKLPAGEYAIKKTSSRNAAGISGRKPACATRLAERTGAAGRAPRALPQQTEPPL